MDKQPVGQLPDLTQSNNDDEIMVITNSEYNQLKKEKISDLITDFTSTNENNALTKGTDGKMFVTDFGNASNITEGTLPVSVLPDSGITAGTYTYPTDIVVNSKGQVTSITEGQAGANNANQDLSNISEAGKEVIRQNSVGMPVGTIFAHTCAADFVPENSLPCDGTEYTQTQFPTFYNDWLVGVRLNTCTYEEYQSDIDNYGKCVKFGLDTASGKFKVPTIPDGTHIQQAMSDEELGKSYNAGLPNITGNFNALQFTSTFQPTGCFSQGTNINNQGGNAGNAQGSQDFSIDASRSSSIYGNSTTVQPESIALRFFVVVATGAINQSEMDWSNWASSLQGKLNVDCTNATAATKEFMAHQAMPSDRYIDLSLQASGATYVAPADGWFNVQKLANSTNQFLTLSVNRDSDSCLNYQICWCPLANNNTALMAPVKKGDIVTIGYTAGGAVQSFKFIYAEGEV